MEARGQDQLDLCDSQTAELFKFEWEGMREEANDKGEALEDNPFYPNIGVRLQPGDAQRLACSISSKIFANHNELREILERHEETIQKRWLKKTKPQRQVILLKAWPNSKYLSPLHNQLTGCWLFASSTLVGRLRRFLARNSLRNLAQITPMIADSEYYEVAPGHHTNFKTLKILSLQHHQDRREGTNKKDTWNKAKHRDPFVWPYINQEDLSQPKALLLLLNARGRHDPCEFAAADADSFWLGTVSNAIVPLRVEDNTMILNGAHGPGEYGKLLAWNEHPDAESWMTSQKQFEPSEGFTILEAQEGLLAFLVKFCKQMLHDIPGDTITSDAFPIKPSPQLKSEVETSGFDSLAVMIAEEPYRVPAQLDLERMEALLAARASAAEDHLWSLREDPGYFSEALWEISEHRVEMLKDEWRKAHPALKKEHKTIFWGRVTGEVLSNAYYELDIFADLHKQTQEIRLLQSKHAATISPMEDLPGEYLRAILKLRYFIDRATVAPMTKLKRYVQTSPSFRNMHFLRPQDDPLSSKDPIGVREVKMTKFEKELLELLLSVQVDGGQVRSTMRMPVVMDNLERLLDPEPKAKDLVSPCVAGVIGDLAILSQCFKQLENYQPWARGFDKAMPQHMDGINEEIVAKRQSWDSFNALKDLSNMMQAVEVGDISSGKLAYPIDKRRTKENVAVLRRSEASLDAFWAFVDKLVYAKVGTLEEQAERGTLNESAVSRILSQSRAIQRTPEWVEPTKQPKTTTAQATVSDTKTIDKSMSSLVLGPSSTKPQPASKIKTKTRGTADAALAEEVPEDDPAADDDEPTAFQVDARTLRVFRTLFHDPSAAGSQGELPWQDFLHAMTSVGFAAEKLYGSVWQFRPVSLDADRSIQFHEPHPRGKVPFRVARWHGRRLSRAYGWGLEMFTLKEK